MSAIQGNRQRLVRLANSRFIEPADFVDRATSRLPLKRADDATAAVHGLLDPESGVCFFVEDEKLDSWQARHKSAN